MFWTDIARFLQYFKNVSNSFINIFAILQDFNGIFSKYSFNITVLCGKHDLKFDLKFGHKSDLKFDLVTINSALSLNTTVTLFEAIFHFSYFFPEGPFEDISQLFTFFSRTIVTLFEDILQLLTFFFQKDRNTFWWYFSAFEFFSRRALTLFKDIFH